MWLMKLEYIVQVANINQLPDGFTSPPKDLKQPIRNPFSGSGSEYALCRDQIQSRKLCSDFNPTYVRPSYKILCFIGYRITSEKSLCLGCSDKHLITLRVELSILMGLNLQHFCEWIPSLLTIANQCPFLPTV